MFCLSQQWPRNSTNLPSKCNLFFFHCCDYHMWQSASQPFTCLTSTYWLRNFLTRYLPDHEPASLVARSPAKWRPRSTAAWSAIPCRWSIASGRTGGCSGSWTGRGGPRWCAAPSRCLGLMLRRRRLGGSGGPAVGFTVWLMEERDEVEV